MADHRFDTTAGASALTGWTVLKPADSYSTGQTADNVAQTAATAMTAAAVHRHRGEGRCPSGKQTTESVVSASATTTSQTPNHAHHRLASNVGECPTCRPKNVTASTTPVAMNSIPTR